MKKKINIQDLKPGMYVSELDRPWLETPFLFQGFEIQSRQEIEEIKRYCEYVFIDTRGSQQQKKRPPSKVEFEMLRKSALPPHKPVYKDQLSLEQELAPARETYSASKILLICSGSDDYFFFARGCAWS